MEIGISLRLCVPGLPDGLTGAGFALKALKTDFSIEKSRLYWAKFVVVS
jgi:hypothetical protein